MVAPTAMTGLFHAHSGIRFLILVLCVVYLAASVVALASKANVARLHRVAGSALMGTLHLQILIGASMVVMGRYYPALVGHIVMMLAAAVGGQVLVSMHRRNPEARRALPLVAALWVLLCLTGGLMAISRGLFTMTAFH